MQQKRTLGLVVLRGETIVSVTVEGPPPVVNDDKTGLMAGPGKGVAAGRGMPLGAGEYFSGLQLHTFSEEPGQRRRKSNRRVTCVREKLVLAIRMLDGIEEIERRRNGKMGKAISGLYLVLEPWIAGHNLSIIEQ